MIRSRQDSNLRSQRESDFQSDALTTRPRLPYVIVRWDHILAFYLAFSSMNNEYSIFYHLFIIYFIFPFLSFSYFFIFIFFLFLFFAYFFIALFFLSIFFSSIFFVFHFFCQQQLPLFIQSFSNKPGQLSRQSMRLLISGSWVRAPRWAKSFDHSKKNGKQPNTAILGL